jgi:predicted NAD-dependent protein-ADP-ribosyltransferase YbiA (DUF1768 family)
VDIGSGKGYPESALSNFAPHPFIFRGIQCNSMEGFLQSLKFSNPEMQKYVCTLVGKKAKFKGKEKNWRINQTLYWNGIPIDRHSVGYQQLLDEAFTILYTQNEKAKNALLASGNAVLEHSIGKSNENETILTKREFCSRLTNLREKLKNNL